MGDGEWLMADGAWGGGVMGAMGEGTGAAGREWTRRCANGPCLAPTSPLSAYRFSLSFLSDPSGGVGVSDNSREISGIWSKRGIGNGASP